MLGLEEGWFEGRAEGCEEGKVDGWLLG